MSEFDSNPWLFVTKLEQLLYFCCPECHVKDKSKDLFLQHVLDEHPKAKDCLENLEIKKDLEIKHESSEAAWDVGGDGNQNEDPDYDQNLNLDKFVKCELGEDFVENSSVSQSQKDHSGSGSKHHKRLRGNGNYKKSSENAMEDFDVNGDSNSEYLDFLEDQIKFEEDAIEDDDDENIPIAKKSKKKRKSLNLHKCQICDKSCKGPLKLKFHISTIHDGIKEPKCDFCELTFGEFDELQNHTLNIHKGQKIYKCHGCDKAFSTLGNLKHHVKIIHENQKNYNCSYCDKKFATSFNLKSHISRTHENDQGMKRELKEEFDLSSEEMSQFTTESDVMLMNMVKEYNIKYIRNNHELSEVWISLTDAYNKSTSQNYSKKQLQKRCHNIEFKLKKIGNIKKNVQDDGVVSLECEFCDKTFVNIYSLQIHLDRQVCQQNRKLERALETAKQTANINTIKSIGK